MKNGTSIELIDKLEQYEHLAKEEWITLLSNSDEDTHQYAAAKARAIADDIYGKDIFIRGLIEYTSYCKNDCYYCGLRCSNSSAQRYRLTTKEIMECCSEGYKLGFRTFVLQGGEDPYFTDDRMIDIVGSIKQSYPDCALTLSIGEKSRDSYERLYEAGADRYLLRHETANEEHYRKLHPSGMLLANRKRCLQDLKDIGYQTGCGFMVGSPWQSEYTLAEDMIFIEELHPQMVGLGPFIPHSSTPFKDEAPGSLQQTLFLLSLVRIMEKHVLLPATTALGTIHPNGREMGIAAGANVVMPNLSPTEVRDKYSLYNGKICTGEESAQCISCLSDRIEQIGYHIVSSRGDYNGN